MSNKNTSSSTLIERKVKGNEYLVYYQAFTIDNVLIGDERILVEAISKNEACKIASMKIDGKHSIKFASQISGPIN